MSIELKVEALKKKLGSTLALNDVSVHFFAGPIHGLIGPEGAGKTTLLRHLVGLLKADEGRIQYCQNGQFVDFESIRAKIAYMPQTQSLYGDLSIDEHLEFFRDIYGLDQRTYDEKKERLLQVTRLAPFLDRAASQLSGGMYKKLGLMCAMLASPDVILLDEPTNGVDPLSRREFWDLLYQLHEEGILVLITTAYMDEAERCGVVHLLNEGRIIGAGEPRKILQKNGVKSFDEYFLLHAETFS